MLERCAGRAGARDTAIGNLPRPQDLNTDGLNLAPEALEALLAVDPGLWRKELAEIGAYLDKFGVRLPQALREELADTAARLS